MNLSLLFVSSTMSNELIFLTYQATQAVIE
jgi:hypothetical protein